MKISTTFLVICIVLLGAWSALAAYGDQTQPGNYPTALEREFMTIFNSVRGAPSYWSTVIFKNSTPAVLNTYTKQDMLWYDVRIATAARGHAEDMDVSSPATCNADRLGCGNATGIVPGENCFPPPLLEYCCFRGPTCCCPTESTVDRVFEAGYQWNASSGLVGELIAAGSPLNGIGAFEAVYQIVCDPLYDDDGTYRCKTDAESDNRRIHLNKDFELMGGGYSGSGPSSYFQTYYDVALGYTRPQNPVPFPNNPIGVASTVNFNGFNMFMATATVNNLRELNVIYGSTVYKLDAIPQSGVYIYNASFPAPSCTQYSFFAVDSSTKVWRYPGAGNLIAGCSSSSWVADTTTCPASCSNAGVCMNGACYCRAGRSGADCAVSTTGGSSGASTLWLSIFAVFVSFGVLL